MVSRERVVILHAMGARDTAQLERALLEDPDVAELVVQQLGGDDARATAFAVPSPGADLPTMRRRLSAHGAELGVRVFPVLVSRLARTSSGSVDAASLADLPAVDERMLRRWKDELQLALGTTDVTVQLEPVADGNPRPPGRTSVPSRPSGGNARRTPPAQATGPPLLLPPELPRSLPDALIAAARAHPTHGVIAYDADDAATAVSYPTLLRTSLRVARGLMDAGIARGDVVLVVCPRLCDCFSALWGSLCAGARPMMLAGPPAWDRRSPAFDKLHAVWTACGEPLMATGGDAVNGLRNVGRLYGGRTPRLFDVSADASDRALDAPLEGGDIALLQLSSGTTGRAKPILLTHRGLLASAVDYCAASGLDPDDRTVNWLPLDHSASLLLMHVFAVVAGATNVHVPTLRTLAKPLHWLDLLERHDAQHSWAPNFAYRLVADALDEAPSARWQLDGLKSLVNGGEPCTLPIVERFLRSSAPLGVRPEHVLFAWGMAETTTAITYKRFGPDAVRPSPAGGIPLLSMGPPCAGAELKVVDEDGRLKHEGEAGRLLVRSERNTPGYLVDGAVQPAAGADGWLDTGDLAVLEDGEIAIAGRLKDVIIVNGVNLLAHEVEHAAGDAPGVEAGSVAAVAVPDAASGTEALAVLYVASSGAPQEQTEAEIMQAVSSVTGIVPRIVRQIAVHDLLRTSTGKIQRAALRERLLAGELGADGVPLARPEARPLEQLVVTLPAEAAAMQLPQLLDGYGRPSAAHVVVRTTDGPSQGPAVAVRRAPPSMDVGVDEHRAVSALSGHSARSAAAPATASSTARPARDRGVAIVGMACRLPGASTPNAYWELLRSGRTAVRRIPDEELLAAGVAPEIVSDPDFVPVGGPLEGADCFAPEDFGMTVREAMLTSPQQRLLLEVARELLVVSGHETFESTAGIGVFAGTGMHLSPLNTYLLTQLGGQVDRRDPVGSFQLVIGNEPDFAATRIAYRLGLTGPALTVQTACSTALSAVHVACRALLAGDCDVAIAGAGAIHVPQPNGHMYRKGSIFSPSGVCRPFDARADGTVLGNGVAAILLKPLDDARMDGDSIHAVIRGSGINNDGATKVGYAAPSAAGQTLAIRRALASAGASPESIAYVQAHGTGTIKGDPIEVQALTRAFGGRARRGGGCLLGSVKPVVGHLDTCAGFAGLMAAVLALQHREAPPQVNFEEPNPELRLEEGPFRIAIRPEPLEPAPGEPLRASVTALGIGGTNVHTVLEAVE